MNIDTIARQKAEETRAWLTERDVPAFDAAREQTLEAPLPRTQLRGPVRAVAVAVAVALVRMGRQNPGQVIPRITIVAMNLHRFAVVRNGEFRVAARERLVGGVKQQTVNVS